MTLKGPAIYEISGIAYSGNGRITKVMVSADGGKSWGEAALQEPVLPKAFTRFRMPWRWDGGPGDPAEPRLGRSGQRAADARANSSPSAARPKSAAVRRAFPTSTSTRSRAGRSTRNGEVKHVYA